MARRLSVPEQKAKCLFERLLLGTRLKDNDGTPNPTVLWFDNKAQMGTSVIKDGKLYRDCKGGDVKNYTRTVPDKLFDDQDYLEIKGKIDGEGWRLNRDAFNDQIRLSLLRIREGVISCPIVNYFGLPDDERAMVADCLDERKREGRRYLHFAALAQVVPSPACNLEWTQFVHGNLTLPIKVVAGMMARPAGRLFILDCEVMGEWENLC
jgi:hypothetical protein